MQQPNNVIQKPGTQIDTKLSKHLWSLKDENKDFDIKCSILKTSSGYSVVQIV